MMVRGKTQGCPELTVRWWYGLGLREAFVRICRGQVGRVSDVIIWDGLKDNVLDD